MVIVLAGIPECGKFRQYGSRSLRIALAAVEELHLVTTPSGAHSARLKRQAIRWAPRNEFVTIE